MKDRYRRYDIFDKIRGYKIFRCDALKRCGKDERIDIPLIYGMKCKKIVNAYMLYTRSKNDLTREIKISYLMKLVSYIKFKQRKCEDRNIYYIKDHFINDDMKKIFKKETLG